MRDIRYAGALPYKLNETGLQILLITARRRHRWIIPKGHWTSSLTDYRSAEKEAYEEAGIEGIIGPDALGIYEHKSARSAKVTPIIVFPLQVTYRHGIWPEKHQRQSRWARPDIAMAMVENSLSRLIRRLSRKIERRTVRSQVS